MTEARTGVGTAGARAYSAHMPRTATIHSLHVYPVKSCHGLDLQEALLGPRGFVGDREWMLVDGAGRFITQRTQPRLARLLVSPGADGRLRLDYEGLPSLMLDPALTAAQGALRRVRIWDDQVEARSAGGAASDWFSTVLGCAVDAVLAGPWTRREPSGSWHGDTAAPVNFPDGYPLLVCSTASLADLAGRMAEPVPMNRFRPNIVLSGLEPYEEDRLDSLRCGGVTLRPVKACTRCSTTLVDQETGLPGSNPLQALQAYRYDRELKGATFGQNVVLVAGAGLTLRVGDRFDCD